MRAAIARLNIRAASSGCMGHGGALFAIGESGLDNPFAISEYSAMKLAFGRQAAKVLGRMPTKKAAAIRKARESIAAAPFAKHANVKPLGSIEDGFRLRAGDWRVLYRLDRTQQTMFVELVKPRGDAYK